MSDSAPPPPPGPSSPPRISDRAALEAALVGAAGLLLGRVLLGRGAGLLAGGAAIAARLMAAAPGTKDPTPDAETASNEKPGVPPPPSSPEEPVTATPILAAEEIPEDAAEAELMEEIACETADDDGWPVLTETPPAGPAPDETPVPPGAPDAAPATGPGLAFADIFQETSPTPAPSDPTAVEKTLVEIPEPNPERPAPLPLPPFPSLAATAPVPVTTRPEEPAPVPSPPAGPSLPAFPELDPALLHPDEIWKRAAEESAPVPPPAIPSPATPSREEAPPEKSSPFLAVSEALKASAPLWEIPSDASNPFAALTRKPFAPVETPEITPDAAPPAGNLIPAAPPPAEEPAAPFSPVPEAPQVAPAPAFPEVTSFAPVPTPVETTSLPEITGSAEAGKIPIPSEPNPILPFSTFLPPVAEEAVAEKTLAPPSPSPSSTPARNAGELPVISLKAPSTSPSESKKTEVSGPFVPVDVAEENPASVPPPAEHLSTAPAAASGGSGKFWLVLLLLAALIAWVYRNELRKVKAFQQSSTPPTLTTPGNNPPVSSSSPSPGPTPAKLPAPAPAPAPAPVPPPPTPTPAPAAQSVPAATPTPPATMPAVPVTPEPAKTQPAAAEPVRYAEPLPGVAQDFPPGSPGEKARQTLEALLAASTTSAAAPLLHRPEEAARRAAVYFPDGQLGPTAWRRILFDSVDNVPQTPYQARLFRVVTDKLPMGFPVAVEDTRDGPRIDFDAFVQCRDRLLDAFVANPAALPGRFLVVVRRGHYFGSDLTKEELDKLLCLEITSPNPGSAKYQVFVRRETELGRQAMRRFAWDKSYTPVVELTHADRHIMLTAIVQESWRGPAP